MSTSNPKTDDSGEPLTRILACMAYDGTAYRGFASQDNLRTVAGDFADAFDKIASFKPNIVCAGRTDAGVHAVGQVIHFDIPTAIIERTTKLPFHSTTTISPLLNKWFRSLNKLLSPECMLYELDFAPTGFHARYSAIYRRYHYDINISTYLDPRLRKLCWHIDEALDIAEMETALGFIVGEHNFAAFCRRPPAMEKDSPIFRRVDFALCAVIETYGYKVLRLEIQANAFCHQMIRSLVGLLVAIGSRKLRSDFMKEKLLTGDRNGMPSLAPPHGLCLTEVGYPEELGGPRSLSRMI